ncbi:uncharacterized protein EV420DRAFT_310485 [Desarmillaria tabescens]|uniref:DUF6534 domain-containing protein n=1 Tax=Armillaria tabescens TaxID=1929756 RepID=A0AA39KFY7_ARMTA|nr:uncharacterized protein EV420DRAFT_310485 [Desarmillaria tabescens]KAK0459240.1 hypothetical protein EV420DRAFT_310485 [Desarmillaria tabescens]
MTSVHLPNMNIILGVPYIGNLFEAALYGITLMQTFLYFRNQRSDPWYFKALVISVLVLDTTNLIMSANALYYYMISNYMNPASLQIPVWNLFGLIYVTTIIGLLVRSFFAMRIYILSKRNKILTGFFIALIFEVFAGGMINATLGLVNGKSFHVFIEKDLWIMYLALVSITTADVSIAIALCWLLRANRTGFKKTDSMVKTLMIYSINAGALSAVTATTTLITFALFPTSLIYLGVFLSLGKLYTNSLLASLNVRDSVRAKGSSDVSNTFGSMATSTTRSYPIPLEQMQFSSSQKNATMDESVVEKNPGQRLLVSISKESDTVFDPHVHP